ncbi:MAG: hypothetical protein ACE5E6_11345 [Phycisphaerae bacterium]
MAPRQAVHVGEDVSFSFVLIDWLGRPIDPLGVADYCVARIGDDRIESTPDANGRFRFAFAFDHFRDGDIVDVRATAYRQRGHRDYMRVAGTWLQSDSPYEIQDQRVASDAITCSVYQTTIELRVPAPPDGLVPDTGVLRIRRADGTTSSVYAERAGRPGFRIARPPAHDAYAVHYRPQGNELNPTGETVAEFTIYDTTGTAHSVSAVLPTP